MYGAFLSFFCEYTHTFTQTILKFQNTVHIFGFSGGTNTEGESAKNKYGEHWPMYWKKVRTGQRFHWISMRQCNHPTRSIHKSRPTFPYFFGVDTRPIYRLYGMMKIFNFFAKQFTFHKFWVTCPGRDKNHYHFSFRLPFFQKKKNILGRGNPRLGVLICGHTLCNILVMAESYLVVLLFFLSVEHHHTFQYSMQDRTGMWVMCTVY